MSKKSSAKKSVPRKPDRAYPDLESIAARLKLAPPLSVGMQIEGRSDREGWIRKGADLDLVEAMHGQSAPSALSHLLTACLRVRGLNDTPDPRRDAALRERVEILVLLDVAAHRYSPAHLEERAMEMARKLNTGHLDWPGGPREFVSVLLGEPCEATELEVKEEEATVSEYRRGSLVPVAETARRLGFTSPEAMTGYRKRAEKVGPTHPLYPLVEAYVPRMGYHEAGVVAVEDLLASGVAAERDRVERDTTALKDKTRVAPQRPMDEDSLRRLVLRRLDRDS